MFRRMGKTLTGAALLTIALTASALLTAQSPATVQPTAPQPPEPLSLKHISNVHGPEARIVRIRATDGSEETVFSAHMVGKAGPTQDDDLLFSLAPDGSLVLHNRCLLYTSRCV